MRDPIGALCNDVSSITKFNVHYYQWNVEVGKRYEIILTTRDGFWRFRLNDIVEVVGFDPCDGQPIIHYIEVRPEFHLQHPSCSYISFSAESKGQTNSLYIFMLI